MSITLATLLGLSKNVLGFNITVKGVIKFVLAGCVAFAIWSFHSWSFERGALAKEKELAPTIAKIEKERDDAKAELTKYKASYEKWINEQTEYVEKLQLEHERQLAASNAKLVEQENKTKLKEREINEIRKLIPVNSPADLNLPIGFVQLYNMSISAGTAEAAAQSGLPGGISGSVETPSGVKLSEFAETVKRNNLECVQRGVIIELWQNWYKGLSSKTPDTHAQLTNHPVPE